MTIKAITTLSFWLLASPIAFAGNAERTLEGFALHEQHLELKTSDGTYKITPYSAHIIETAFIPDGESAAGPSHAVTLVPAPVKTRLLKTAAQVEYRTDALAVVITRLPFKIAYTYKGKPLISEKNGYARKNDTDIIDFELDRTESLYGAGARATGMNRRGKRFALYNKAHYGYSTRSELMNYTMPLAMSSKMYAIHFDNPQIGHLDFDSQHNNTLSYETIGGRKTYQVIAGDTWKQLVGNYTSLTGKQPLPPRWALGNFASRFGYHTAAEATSTVDKFIDEDIPLDAIIFDLYWFGKEMKGTMGNLEFDKDNFPDPKKMIADFADKGVKTILITEPFILTTSKRWQEAVDQKILATDAQGAPFVYDFYFGQTGLIDIFSQRGKDWFWNIYKDLHQMGVAGWWGDLGEPEVHPAALLHATGTADQVHNIYGHEWARLIAEGYQKDFPNERPFILMRAGYSGSQRFGLIPWSGDVERSWGGLQSQTEIALQMGMQGLGYMHSDLGGFASPNLDDELYARWLQYGVFQPIFRPHAQEEVASEPVYREQKTKALAREAIRLRYRMLPYNYTIAFDNNQHGTPLMRPMLFEEPGNAEMRSVSSTYLWGDDLLVTPIVHPGQRSKAITFPSRSAWFDLHTGQRHAAGSSATVAVVPEHIPVFVRAGAFLPMVPVVQTSRDYTTGHIELHYYHDDSVNSAHGKLYDDDGSTQDAFAKGQFELVRFASEVKDQTLAISLATQVGANYRHTKRRFTVQVHNIGSKPASVLLEGAPLAFAWDAQRKLLTLDIAENERALSTLNIALRENGS